MRSFLVAALLVTGLASAPAFGSAAPAPPVTVKIFVAPVTTSGLAVSGYTVKAEPDDVVSCSPAYPSPVSISPNVEECSPSAAYAVACWKSATAHQVLCLLDPRKHQLTAAKLTGKFATTKAISKKELSPFVIVLSDGTYCSIRDGGAWGSLKSHPNYFGSYSCSKHGVVWSPPNAAHYGVDESAASWTVRTGSAGGGGALTTRHVAKAYFVATASS